MILYENTNVLGDNKGYLKLVSVMGSDLQIVNDARVSYDKVKSEFDTKDDKLLKFLIRHKHTSPLRGCVIKYEVCCPIFVARQWWKHHISSNFSDEQDGWNEMSLRYTTTQDYYIPPQLRYQSQSNKQVGDIDIEDSANQILLRDYIEAIETMKYTYNKLIRSNVCREQARGVLPSCMYTKFRWTTSLHGLLNFISLRDKPGAQYEIRAYAESIKEIIEPSFPVTMKYFLEN